MNTVCNVFINKSSLISLYNSLIFWSNFETELMKYVYINNYVRDDDLTRPVQKRESEVFSTARALKYLNYMFGIRRNMKVKLFFLSV